MSLRKITFTLFNITITEYAVLYNITFSFPGIVNRFLFSPSRRGRLLMPTLSPVQCLPSFLFRKLRDPEN